MTAKEFNVSCRKFGTVQNTFYVGFVNIWQLVGECSGCKVPFNKEAPQVIHKKDIVKQSEKTTVLASTITLF